MKIKFKHIRLALIIILLLIFAFSAFQLIRILVGYQQGANDYDAATDMAGAPDLSDLPLPTLQAPSPSEDGTETPEPSSTYVDPYAEALQNMDFAALREVNSHVLGWILIPGTTISYPIVQGEDNEYYLNHTWRNTYNSVGAIFMECKNSGDFSDFNTILYGHRMNNRSMFGVLHRFVDQSYWETHPYVYITDDNGCRRYDIFAAYEVSTAGDTYRIGFSGTQSMQSFLDFCMAQSVIDTGITPTVNDRILTLSTCTGHGHATRWVVQAVCRGEPPAQEQDLEQVGPSSQVTPESQTFEPPVPSATSTATPAPRVTDPPVQTPLPQATGSSAETPGTPSQAPDPQIPGLPVETPEPLGQDPAPSASDDESVESPAG